MRTKRNRKTCERNIFITKKEKATNGSDSYQISKNKRKFKKEETSTRREMEKQRKKDKKKARTKFLKM